MICFALLTAGCCVPQVYELLDVLEGLGPAAVAEHSVPLLSWEEVQVLTGPGTVGLPLGYKPDVQQKLLLGRPAVPAASSLPAASAGMLDGVAEGKTPVQLKMTAEGAVAAADMADHDVPHSVGAGQQKQRLVAGLQGGVDGTVVVVDAAHDSKQAGSGGALSWRQQGWQRSEYLTRGNRVSL
jgi:hypothetical protein